MNLTQNVDNDCTPDGSQNVIGNLVNETEINSSSTKHTQTTDDIIREMTTTTGRSLKLVNGTEIDKSTITPTEQIRNSANNAKTDEITDRPSELFGRNETEIDFTTVRASKSTGDSVNDTKTDKIEFDPSEMNQQTSMRCMRWIDEKCAAWDNQGT